MFDTVAYTMLQMTFQDHLSNLMQCSFCSVDLH